MKYSEIIGVGKHFKSAFDVFIQCNFVFDQGPLTMYTRFHVTTFFSAFCSAQPVEKIPSPDECFPGCIGDGIMKYSEIIGVGKHFKSAFDVASDRGEAWKTFISNERFERIS